jgi:UDP-N-acetyl-D-mannosaminuronate dehydrogenase
MKNKTVCIVGLGYVGLPLANVFVIENKSVESVLICG